MALSIGDVAARLGLNPSAIRYYESAGLIAPSGRRSGRRVYDAKVLDEIGFVARSRQAGLSISDIKRLIVLAKGIDPDSVECRAARSFAADKIVELDRQIAEAQALRAQLAAALDAECGDNLHCTVP